MAGSGYINTPNKNVGAFGSGAAKKVYRETEERNGVLVYKDTGEPVTKPKTAEDKAEKAEAMADPEPAPPAADAGIAAKVAYKKALAEWQKRQRPKVREEGEFFK